jgi:ABC-type multidrug transport system fused ATPase/permease subunit
MGLLRTYLLSQRSRVALLALFLLLGTGFQLAIPQILSRFIDAATQAQPMEVLTQLAAVFWLTTLVSYAVNFGRAYFKEHIAWATTNRLRSDLAAHCMRLDMRFHHTHTPGALIERIDGDVSALANLLSDFVFVAITDLLLLAGVLIVTLLENLQIGLAFMTFAVVALFILYRMRSMATREFELDRQRSADLYSFLEERLSGIADIRANGAVGYTMNRLFRTMGRSAQANIHAYNKIIRLRTTMILLFSFGSILALALGVIFYRNDAITLGTVFTIWAYMRMLSQPIERLTLQVQNFQTGNASLNRIQALLDTPTQIDDGTGTLPQGPLDIRFENVRFRYNDDALILPDLSFQLAAGKTLGLLGRTGSGKTSIARLLLRFYDPEAGAIRLGGVDIREVPLANLRSRIALVTQDVQIFSASLRDNVCFFETGISDQHLLAVIESLGLKPWFDRLPAGLDTLLESDQLSAGEAQLVALARVFLKQPDIVILDEASSRLDPETEALVDRAITRLMQGRTGIIIAHRLATIQRVDMVMVLSGGEILEYGDRETLASSEASAFEHLLRASTNEVLS